MPAYSVLRADDAIELRSYQPQVHAEVTTSGTRDEAASAAFRQLAAYIFDKERPEGKIAMTAPVVQQPEREAIAMTAPVTQSAEGDGIWTTAFIMPDKWSLATLPKPQNPNIRLREEPAKKVAAIRFSGRANMAMLSDNQEKLEAWLASNAIAATGPATYAFYNAPFVPGPLRRNEVIIPVE